MDSDLTTHYIEGIARMGNTSFRVPLFSHIARNIWSGGCPRGEAPKEFQFVVCLYPWEPYKRHEHQTYLEARLYDAHDMPETGLLYALADYINAVEPFGKVLVHCQAGLNRSALVTGLALIRAGMEAAEAVALLRKQRCDAVLCNPTFEAWLLQEKAPRA